MSEGREVLRCEHCRLVQFVVSSRICRRCRQSFDKVEVKPEVVSSPIPVPVPNRGLNFWLPLMLAYLRAGRGLSERQLAASMKVPRTYVSKVENGNAVPNITSLFRFCRALEVEPVHVLRMTEFMVLGQ